MNPVGAGLILGLVVVSTASAAPPPPTSGIVAVPLWKDDWRRVSWPEFGAFAALEATSLIGPLVIADPVEPRWRGGILFDDTLQDALRLGSGRGSLSSATDVGLIAMQALPLVDAGVTAWWFRRDRDAAFELALVDLESYAFTDVTIWALKTAVARQRPQDYRLGCFTDAGTDPACKKAKNTSFPSNHAATSFTAASLFCTEHAQMHLYGGAADLWSCVGALAAATGISTARVMADHHYTSDILVGAAIGVFSGWAIPRLLHFRRARADQDEKPSTVSLGVLPLPTPSGMTLALLGSL